MSITLYGIPNCNTVKKARDWLAEHHITYAFHNFKKDGLARETLQSWVDRLGWETLINKQGTTWRKIDASDKENLNSERAIELMLANTSVIKRPVLEYTGNLSVGFKPERYQDIFS